MIETYKATEQCKICKGNCCKHMACHYAPSDFKDLSFEGLKAEIEKGKISIDWWDGYDADEYEYEYFLRARHIGEPVLQPSWGGICVNLTETGCSLSWEERPLGAKALKPRENELEQCHSSYTKEQCKNDWRPYNHILEELAEYFTEHPLPPNMGIPGMMEIVLKEEQEQKLKEYKTFREDFNRMLESPPSFDGKGWIALPEICQKQIPDDIQKATWTGMYCVTGESRSQDKIFMCRCSIEPIYPEDEEEKQNSGLLEE